MNNTVDLKNINFEISNILFVNGLTLERLKIKYNWIFNAKIKNAILGEDSNGLVWYSGEWICGEWKGGTWYSGLWHDGIWETGQWYSYNINKFDILNNSFNIIDKGDNYSIFKNGLWKNGTWYSGTFGDSATTQDWEDYEYFTDEDGYINMEKYLYVNGILDNDIKQTARWLNGIFNDGIITNSIWIDGQYFGGNIINSIWIDGQHFDGIFNGYKWYNGKWFGGDFISGKWMNGIFNKNKPNINSRFGYTDSNKSLTCEWYNGTWYNGDFYSGYILSNNVEIPSNDNSISKWYDGIFKNGTWYGGHFENGTWENGLWKKGIFGSLFQTDWLKPLYVKQEEKINGVLSSPSIVSDSNFTLGKALENNKQCILEKEANIGKIHIISFEWSNQGFDEGKLLINYNGISTLNEIQINYSTSGYYALSYILNGTSKTFTKFNNTYAKFKIIRKNTSIELYINDVLHSQKTLSNNNDFTFNYITLGNDIGRISNLKISELVENKIKHYWKFNNSSSLDLNIPDNKDYWSSNIGYVSENFINNSAYTYYEYSSQTLISGNGTYGNMTYWKFDNMLYRNGYFSFVGNTVPNFSIGDAIHVEIDNNDVDSTYNTTYNITNIRSLSGKSYIDTDTTWYDLNKSSGKIILNTTYENKDSISNFLYLSGITTDIETGKTITGIQVKINDSIINADGELNGNYLDYAIFLPINDIEWYNPAIYSSNIDGLVDIPIGLYKLSNIEDKNYYYGGINNIFSLEPLPSYFSNDNSYNVTLPINSDNIKIGLSYKSENILTKKLRISSDIYIKFYYKNETNPTWLNGIWETGLWLNGDFYNGKFISGLWNTGNFYDGQFGLELSNERKYI